MAQYDPIAVKSGIPSNLGVDTLRSDKVAEAGLTTTGLAAGDVVQVTANLTLSKANNALTTPVVGVYDGISGSVVREGVVVATFVSGLTVANGDVAYLSSTAGALTNVKPTRDVLHEVGVVVDAASSKILLQQKPVIVLPEVRLFLSLGQYGSGAFNPGEVFSPKNNAWSNSGVVPVYNVNDPHSCRLGDGTVLCTGGSQSTTYKKWTQTFDPATGLWTARGDLTTQRSFGTLFPLANGGAVLAGGSQQYNIPDNGLSSCEKYDLVAGTWSPTGSLPWVRYYMAGAPLLDGRYLVAGGIYVDHSFSTIITSTAAVYNPSTELWTSTANNLTAARWQHAAVTLLDGRVLVIGGVSTSGTRLSSCNLYNPTTNTWSATGSLNDSRNRHAACLLSDGRVLMTGGMGGIEGGGTSLRTEIYDPTTELWTYATSKTRTCVAGRLFALSGGRVIAYASEDDGGVGGSRRIEIYAVGSDSWTELTQSSYKHDYGCATALLV